MFSFWLRHAVGQKEKQNPLLIIVRKKSVKDTFISRRWLGVTSLLTSCPVTEPIGKYNDTNIPHSVNPQPFPHPGEGSDLVEE